MTFPTWTARVMSPCEAAWVAGIIDGEGTITARTKPYPGGKRYQIVSLSACNTDLDLIARLVEFTGIGRLHYQERVNHKRKEIWQWRTDQRQAAMVLEQLLPWLTAKRRVAELLLEMQSLRRPGKYLDGALERQRQIIAEVRACNQRGSTDGTESGSAAATAAVSESP